MMMLRHTRKFDLWLKYMCILMPNRTKRSLHLYSVKMQSEKDNSLLTEYYSRTVKHLADSTMFDDCVSYMDKCSHFCVASFLSKPHHDDHSVTMKPFIYSQAGNHFLLQVWPLHNLMCQTQVLICCVRSFSTKKNRLTEKSMSNMKSKTNRLTEKSMSNMRSTEEAVTDHVVLDAAVTDNVLTDKVATEQTTYSQTATEFSPHRIQLFAKLLHCSIDEMKNLVIKNTFFCHLAPELIETKVNIMMSFKLPYSFAFKYPRLLYQTSAQELYRRLEMLQAHTFLSDNSVVSSDNVAHYLECRNDYFDYIFEKLCAERDALEGCRDQEDYIQFRLKCSKEEANRLMTSYPLKRHCSNVKLKSALDFFLIEAKVDAQFVIRHHRLLPFSVMRLRERWTVINLKNIQSETKMSQIFLMPQREFEKVYNDSSAST